MSRDLKQGQETNPAVKLETSNAIMKSPSPTSTDLPHTLNALSVKSESPDLLDRPRVVPYSLDNSSLSSIGGFKPNLSAKSTKSTKKVRRKSLLSEDKVLISTSSPEGIAAANEITPNRIAKILLKEGPLPIRHLTAHLITQVPAFGSLSLSKQRRLIMSSLGSGDTETSAVFEKIGWGQWEAKKVSMDIVNHRIEKGEIETAENDISPTSSQHSLSDSRTFRKRTSVTGSNLRRESITNTQNEHNVKMPLSPSLLPIQHLRNSIDGYDALDEAIESSSSFEEDDDIDNAIDLHHHRNEHAEADDLGYTFNKSSPPLIGADAIYGGRNLHPRSSSTSLTKPANLRSGSVVSSRRPSFVAGISKQPLRKPRSSFTQHTIEAALDDTSMDRREPRVSFSNTSAKQSFLRTRQLIDNEHAIDDEYTDEEDWEAIGANTLRKSRQPSLLSPPTPVFDGTGPAPGPNARKADEEIAAIALMDMKN